MNNFQTGVVVLTSLMLLAFALLLYHDARRTTWRITFKGFLSWVWEIIWSVMIAIGVFTLLAGLTWVIGFLVNGVLKCLS